MLSFEYQTKWAWALCIVFLSAVLSAVSEEIIALWHYSSLKLLQRAVNALIPFVAAAGSLQHKTFRVHWLCCTSRIHNAIWHLNSAVGH